MANSLNKITTKSILDATVATADIADNAVDGDKLADDITLAGTLTLPDTITHTGDTNTKIRFPAADTVSVEAGGLEKLRIEGDYTGTVDVKGSPAHLRLNSSRDTSDWDATDPIGKLDYYVGLDTTNNLPYNAGFIHCLNETDNADEPSGALVFGTSTANASGGAVERLRIASSGQLGIGTNSPDQLLHLEGSSTAIIRLTDTDTSAADNSLIGGIEFETRDSNGAGVNASMGAYIRDTSNGDAYLAFKAGTAASTYSEELRIDNDGLKFHGDTAADNALDDYEEGTWNVSVSGGEGGGPTTYSNTGWYTKVGRVVHAHVKLHNVTFPALGGLLQLSAPFTAHSSIIARGGTAYWEPTGVWDDYTDFIGMSPAITQGSSAFQLDVFRKDEVPTSQSAGSGNRNGNLTEGSGVYLQFSITYFT